MNKTEKLKAEKLKTDELKHLQNQLQMVNQTITKLENKKIELLHKIHKNKTNKQLELYL